jgi:hypothetical protein
MAYPEAALPAFSISSPLHRWVELDRAPAV